MGNRIYSPQPTVRQFWRSPGFGTHGEIQRRAKKILSCTIVVCGASKWMETYHDRMPVILDEKDFDRLA